MRPRFLVYIVVVVVVLRVDFLGFCNGGKLKKNFYSESCPHAEKIVRDITWKHVESKSSLPAKFLRMHFHDCFVRV